MLILGIVLPSSVLASYLDNPPAQAGFTHSQKFTSDDNLQGLQLPGKAILRGSPTIAEIDGNTANGKEIVVGADDGWLYVYHQNATLAWRQNVLPNGEGSCSFSDSEGVITTAPSVGSLFGDGVEYVVVSYGTIVDTHTDQDCRGGLAAYDGRNGSLRWRHTMSAPDKTEPLHGVISSPALADVDGNGTLEVGYGSFERNIEMLNSDGSLRWSFHNADTVWSSPAFADVDGDGLPDMIIGSDITANSRVNPPTQDGGYVTAFRGSDCGFSSADNRCHPIWRNFYTMTIWSSPSIADLDGDGVKEVIVGAGCFDGFNPDVNGHWVKILNLRTGGEIRTLNAAGCVAASPAIADLDGDGKLDIVAGVDGRHNNPPGPGRVQAWSYDNPTPKWTTTPLMSSDGSNDIDIGNLTSPVVADIDGNGSLEVLIVNKWDVAVLAGANGAQLSCNGSGCGSKPTLFGWWQLKSTPAVGDLDGDGDLEVVIGGGHLRLPQIDSPSGFLYVWTNITGFSSPSNVASHYSAPWPMFHGNARHTGIVAVPQLRIGATSVTLLTEKDGPARTFGVALTDAAGGAIDWTASKDQPWISLSATSGTTPDTLEITIDPSGENLGAQTGTVTVSSALGSATIDVTLNVVDTVYDVNLPLVRR
jgi:hypothetical protein